MFSKTLRFTFALSCLALAACSGSQRALPIAGLQTMSSSSPRMAMARPFNGTAVYVSTGSAIQVMDSTGSLLNTLPIASTTSAMDPNGTLYSLNQTSFALSTISAYDATGAPTGATYTPSTAAYYFLLAGHGELVASDITFGVNSFDVWDKGKTGAPSRTFTAFQNYGGSATIGNDGTLYFPSVDTAGHLTYLVYPPGASTPSRTIAESIVPPSQQSSFVPNYMAVDNAGNLYVTEYTFQQPDPLAGLYVYPATGPERFVRTTSDAQGPGPEGLAIDRAGNVYVANDNQYYDTATHPDTLHDIEVFSPGAASLIRHITGNFDPIPITAAPDGTLYGSSFGFSAVNGLFVVPAGASTATSISSSPQVSVTIYNAHGNGARGI